LPQAEADKIDAMLKELKVSWQLGNYCQHCLCYHQLLLYTCMCFSLFCIYSFLILIFLKRLYWCVHMAASICAAFFWVSQTAVWVCCGVNTYNCS
jgi:hypothetical protein